MLKRKKFKPRNLPCLVRGCGRFFSNVSGLTQHARIVHDGSRASSVLGSGDARGSATPPPLRFTLPPPLRFITRHHPLLNEHPALDDFFPYMACADFELADLLYRRVQMSAGAINELMQNWAVRPESAGDPPFADAEDMYNTIDATEIGHVPWESFAVKYNQPITPGDNSPWKTQDYIVHFCDPRKVLQQQLANPDFKLEMDFVPKQAWKQADIIVEDPTTHGSTYVPVILGSDKTTVSIATGQNEYYPLYMLNGLVHNGVQRAHRNAVTLIGFLMIPKTDRENQDSNEFHTFRHSLFHGSLQHILQVTQFADGHYRRVIYGLGPYIADYPEQVLLACVVQGWCASLFDIMDHGTMWDQYGVVPDILPFTWDFPRADIYELLSPDLLHQVIKGTFKDHLVAWVGNYLEAEHGKAKAKKIMADIDRRIVAVPPFPGLRRFPEGQGFKQWTGDDSKALMKVYLLAIEGHVPTQMVRTIGVFLDFCYLVRRNVIDEATLLAIDAVLAGYHHKRTIFVESGVCPDGFCLPRQHSLTHYRFLIQEFGAPNGLCSSITDRFEALGQMLTINDRLDKLAAAHVDFMDRGMLTGPASDGRKILGEVLLARTHVCKYPRNADALAQHLNLPDLVPLIHRFLYLQDHPDHDPDIPLDECPDAPNSVRVFLSAVAKFYVPSDQSGVHGMLRECIRAVRSWHGGAPWYDCVFVEGDPDLPGFQGLLAAHVLLFMSFKHMGILYPCALVTWFSTMGDDPCPDVRMWMVEPDVGQHGERVMDIIHVDTILRGAHLIGIYGDTYLPRHFKHSDTLDRFNAFYVNKYADHHANEIAF
ncbi:hypothetical protein C8J57DRAFT_1437087 [Mycena rebaudengoi]|nr:hypothetical protein C8J57DRAFT_1437087 [Mycena rebaudengoi]